MGTTRRARGGPPVLWTETDLWAEVARLAAERGLALRITDDPAHPLNPVLRLVTAPPGGVPKGHPGLTPRVLQAVETAQLQPRASRPITDEDGPHRHHWQAVLWWCRGCGAFDEE
jgi:hypothetical protein